MKKSGGAVKKTTLQSRLGAWDEAASQAVTRTGSKSRNWLIYTTAVGSALAMATDAGAGIVQYAGGPVAASLNAGLFGPSYLKFPIGGAKFELAGVIFPSSFGNVAFGGGSGNAGVMVNSTLGVRNLASGAKISSQGHFKGGLHTVKYAGAFGQYGSFAAGVPGFAGIEFNTANSSSPAKIHFGWVKLEFGGIPFPNSIEVISWAYNTVAGQAIAAGQTSAAEPPPTTPEPGTAALSLLAMGAAGVLAWRRKKSALNTV
jgi:hypothetical protein